MKISLIGGSGFVGKAVLKELLHKGHQVTAIVLNQELEPQDKLTIVKGDVNDADELAGAIKGSDAVISAFNAGWTNPNLYDDFLKGSRAIQTGVKILE